MEVGHLRIFSRQNTRVLFRIALVLAIVEGITYVAMFLYEANMLSKGGAHALNTAKVHLGGLVFLSGTRAGNVSDVSPAGWVIPALLLLPFVVAAAAVVAKRSIGDPRQA